ncbi:MAG: (Fe-S)-binding protein, partial [Deltaproteobacteria bacterium]|nr:(Fe-S)-binding protein [Deltaproteobacteria bacterium]
MVDRHARADRLCSCEAAVTHAELQALLADQGGRRYYREMEGLAVDTAQLAAALDAACTTHTRAWLKICARCGLCAANCAFYLAGRDPRMIPAYKVRSTLGEMLRRKGRVDT